MYTIEKDIPRPARGGGRAGAWINLARSMVPGDSVFFENAEMKTMVTIQVSMRRLGRFSFRKVEGGYRLWCVEKKEEQ